MRRALRLYPGPQADLDASEIYEYIDFRHRTNGSKKLPYVILNAVSTLDGKVSKDGSSSGIGSDVDRLVMRTIRSKVDAILVGAGTIRSEKLSLSVTDEQASLRREQGEREQPLGVVLSRTGEGLKLEELREAIPNLLVMTEEYLPHAPGDTDEGDELEAYLRILNTDHGVKTLLVEGGPTVNHSLFREQLVDELFLTLTPKVYGGEETNLVSGEQIANGETGQKLVSVYSCESELFLRYSTS